MHKVLMRAGWIVALIGLIGASSHASAPDGNKLVTAALIADVEAVQPGKPFRIAVQFKIEPNWHIYWINPGDSGQPPEVTWKLPDGFVVSDLEWPVPHRFDLPGGIVNYGYESEAALLATVTPPAKIDGQTIEIAAEITWLVCDPDVCLPGSGLAAMKLPIGAANTAANVEQFEKWSAAIPQKLEASDAPATLGADDTAVSANSGVVINWKNPARRIEWFLVPPEGIAIPNTSASTTMRKTTKLSAEIKREFGNNPPPSRIYSVVAYQDEQGTRKGIELWLNVDLPPDAGGGGQTDR